MRYFDTNPDEAKTGKLLRDELGLPSGPVTEVDMERWTRLLGVMDYEMDVLGRRTALEIRAQRALGTRVRTILLPYVKDFLAARAGIAGTTNMFSTPWGALQVRNVQCCNHADLYRALARHAEQLGPDGIKKFLKFRYSHAPSCANTLRTLGATLPSYTEMEQIIIRNALPTRDEERCDPWLIDDEDE